jgi:hypothetical protein
MKRDSKKLTIFTIFIFGWQKANESPQRLAQLGEIEIVTPAGHSAEFAGVITGKRLLVALEHLGDVDDFTDVDVG